MRDWALPRPWVSAESILNKVPGRSIMLQVTEKEIKLMPVLAKLI